MKVKPSDGGGIIGTPIEVQSLQFPDEKTFFKISAADKIAPRKVVFEKTREMDVKREENKILTKAEAEAARPVNLYEPCQRKSDWNSVEKLMDEEDKADMRLGLSKKRASLRRRTAEARPQDALVPFAIAATDLPEIIPRLRTVSIGYSILRNIEKRKGLSTIVKPKPQDGDGGSNDRYGLADLFTKTATVRNSKDRKGLGYQESSQLEAAETELGAKLINKGGRLTLVSNMTDSRERDAEVDELKELANSGYQGLNAKAVKVQRSLERSRLFALEKMQNLQKRSYLGAGLQDDDRKLFSNFEKVETIVEGQRYALRSLTVPPEFAANPKHDSANDRFRPKAPLLPTALQKEYDLLEKTNLEIRLDDTRTVNASIARAKEKREEKLRKIRERFSEDMHSSFISSSQSVSTEELRILRRPKSSVIVDIESRKAEGIPKREKQLTVGDSNRTVQEWKPCLVLRKRFGVSIPKEDIASECTGELQTRSQQPLGTTSDEEEDFQVHAIVGADGQRIDFRSASTALIPDDSVVLTISEPRRVRESKRTLAIPSQELYKVIFNGARKSVTTKDKDQEVVPRASQEVQTFQTNFAHRGIHKSRAADFF